MFTDGKRVSQDMQDISNIELRTLRYFVAAAEELHFRRAAARLGIAQPPLSQAMQKLERDIGVELFDRTQRQVRLTEAGRAFLTEARRTIAQATRTVRAAQRAAQGLVGSVRVTYVGAATYEFLPRLIRRYRAAHPDVELELIERPTAAQVRALQLGEADVGFVRPPVFNADDLRFETIARDDMVVALPGDHRLASHEVIDLGDLAGEGFVMFPPQHGPSFHAHILTACEEAGFSMRVVQEAVQMHTIVSLVVAGLGIALVPGSMRNLRQVGVVYRDLRTPAGRFQAELATIWRRGEPSSVVTGFLDQVRSLGSS